MADTERYLRDKETLQVSCLYKIMALRGGGEDKDGANAQARQRIKPLQK